MDEEGGVMPWRVRKGKGKRPWKIVKRGGKVVGSSTNRQDAKASVRARYVNEYAHGVTIIK